MASNNLRKLFLHVILLATLLFGLVQIIVSNKGVFSNLQLAGLIMLLVLCAVGFAVHPRKSQYLFFAVYFMYLCDLLLIWYFYETLYLVLLLTSLFGFMVSIPQKRATQSATPEETGEVCEVLEPAKDELKNEPVRESAPKPSEESKPKVKFTPGKYVASKRSNVYHEPKCEWARKIQKVRRVWFVSREEALNKGYKKHDCVK
ncbi:MAG: hypothetical protein AABX64_03210 [Nanoarchaeota archaeon]